MFRSGVFAAALGLLCQFAHAQNSEPAPDPDVGTHIHAAVQFEGQLWVLGNGKVVTFDLRSGARVLRIPGGAVDMRKRDQRILILTELDHRSQFLEWKQNMLVPVSRVLSLGPDDHTRAQISLGTKNAIVTAHAIYVEQDAGWTVFLNHMPHDGDYMFRPDAEMTSGAPTSNASVYIGLNQGEWGGALDRIDIATGQSTRVTEQPGDTKERRPLSEPVTAIVADLADTNCVIAAIGIVHFMPFGELVRACGDTSSTFFDPVHPIDREAMDSGHEAFFGLVPSKDGFWAVSNAAVYRFGRTGEPQRFVLKHAEPWHGLWISREAPGALVLITEINRQFSVNSGTPLVVPLD